ncbi:MAG: hypothetical protein LBK67_00790 [Coriobacteriales bacterium]|jgi:hypothetical protein|nr:hypothetical protein [Coriobacteriales bacterium]
MPRKYDVAQLSDFLDSEMSAKLLETKLREFRCKRDSQLEKFIHTQAMRYELKGFSRTYLVFDTDENPAFESPTIAAFFSLAITATDYSEIGRNKREKVLGSKPGRETFRAFGGILIGQLARDDRYDSSFINGGELLDECEKYIEFGRQYIGGRIIYLDCKKELVQTYQKGNYKLLIDAPSSEGYFKMYKILPDKIIA